MEKKKLQRRRGDRLDAEIFRVTYQLLENEGYQAVTFARIAREAETSRSVLYRHWDTPFDLVFEAVHDRNRSVEFDMHDLDFDQGSLEEDLYYVGDNFLTWLTSVPTSFNQMMLLEIQNQPKRIKQIMQEARTYNISVMEHVLKNARRRGELTKFPPEETKLALFQIIRCKVIIESADVTKKELWVLVRSVVKPAIQHFDY